MDRTEASLDELIERLAREGAVECGGVRATLRQLQQRTGAGAAGATKSAERDRSRRTPCPRGKGPPCGPGAEERDKNDGSIDLHVRLRGKEPVLRLAEGDGEWHAALLVPGKTDWLTEECPAPSPPGAWLPAGHCEPLATEGPSGNVESIALGRLLLSGRDFTAEDGWVKVLLRRRHGR